MKKIMMIIALAGMTTVFAQENKNEKKETVVTKTTVKNDKGTDVATKAVTKTEKQVIALEGSDVAQTNQQMVMLTTDVNTEVSYNNGGVNYSFEPQENGYKMITYTDAESLDNYALLRPSTQKGYYIISQDGSNSFGYFNQNGNFVVESYNADSDDVITTVYKLEVKEQTMMKKNKM